MDKGSNEWARVEGTAAFQEVARRKRAFVLPATIFFLAVYVTLPVLAAFTTVLSGEAFSGLSWAYVYAYAEFVLTLVLVHMYLSRARKWDGLMRQARVEATEEGVKVS